MTKPTNAGLRHSVGLTQRQLAAEIGIPYQNIQEWERGLRPLRTHYPKMAKLFKCSTDVLYEAHENTITKGED